MGRMTTILTNLYSDSIELFEIDNMNKFANRIKYVISNFHNIN